MNASTKGDNPWHAGRDFTRWAGRILLVVSAILPAGLSLAAEPTANASAAADKPAWLGSQAGISDELLAPWTPVDVARDAGTVRVWGRTCRFTGLPLPSSIVARDAEILAAPIALEGTVNGQKLAWSPGKRRVVQSKPSLAELAVEAESAAVRCQGTVQVEYDGMIRCDLTLAPKNQGEKVSINELTLVVPLRARHALFLHSWPGRWGSAFNSAALPKDGYRGPFKPLVWLGDHWRGLAWFSESDRNFFLNPKDPAIEIRRQGDVVQLCVHLIGKPTPLAAPLDYTFGFQATPVKPAKPDVWDYRICHLGRYGIENPTGNQPSLLERLAKSGVRTICFHEHWTDIQNYPQTTHVEQLQKLVKACHAHGLKLLLYHGYELSNIAPEWNRWSEECLVAPRAGGYKRKPEQIAYIVCYRSPWKDFLADGLEKLIGQYGIDGVYLDGTSEPWACKNVRHGCGYKRPDGSVGATYSIFATRAMMKRIYTLVKKHDPEGQVNVHQSTCMTIPTLSFATSYWDGEQLQSLKRGPKALEVLPVDAFCAEFMGHNWGVPAELLWYANGPFTHGEAASLALIHDVLVRPSTPSQIDESSKMWRAMDDLGRSQAAWLPYWENDGYVRTGSPNVKASLYNRPGKGLIAVLVNLGPEACQANVQLDLAALQQPAELTARDVLSEKPVAVTAGRLDLSLKPLEFVMLRLTGK